VILIGLTIEGALGTAPLRVGLGRSGPFAMVYVALRYDALINAQGFPPVDVAVGPAPNWSSRRRGCAGAAMPILGALCVAYYVFGHHLPASWGAPYTPFSTVISNLSIGLYSGIFGQFMAISANDVFLFMVFGGLLESLDASRSFNEVGKFVSRKLPGGSGLTTVVSSG
jgi:TRAP-type uncharacterized transport system fused permease subunit